MIPLKDDAPRYAFPFVTILLIVVNCFIFFYQVSLGPRQDQRLVMQYGMIPARVEAAVNRPSVPLGPAIEPLFSSMFLHSGWLHLIGNMWFLWIFGDNVEDALGHFSYLIFYLSSGIFAGIVHTFFNWGSRLPAIGASGAIAGVMGAFIVTYPRDRVRTLVFFIWFFKVTYIPAILLIGFWFVIQLFSGVGSVANAQSGGGVAYMAHVGGFIFGAITARLFEGFRPIEERY